MHQKKFAITAAVLGLALGAGWGGYAAYSRVTQAETLAPEISWSKHMASEAVRSIQKELDLAVLNEKERGCVKKDKFDNDVFCGASKERIDALYEKLIAQVRQEQFRGIAVLGEIESQARELSGNASLELSFIGNSANPYNERKDKRIETYRDEKGNQYMADIATNHIVSFTDESVSAGASGAVQLSAEALREQTERYLMKNVPNFALVKKQFTYEEGTKGGMAVFRWNGKAATDELAPFVMLKLSADGRIIGFSDTRSLYE